MEAGEAGKASRWSRGQQGAAGGRTASRGIKRHRGASRGNQGVGLSPYRPTALPPFGRVTMEQTTEYVRVFTGETRRRLDEILKRYPTKRAALLAALWMVQELYGWISDDGMAETAEVLDLTPSYVKGVVTFYTMYHQHPVGMLTVE